MRVFRAPLPPRGHPRFASDLIAENHRHLPMLRVLLPVCREVDGREELLRWSAFTDLEHETAEVEWHDVVDRVRADLPWVQGCEPATGELDAETLGALAEAVGTIEFTSLRWMGYAEGLRTRHPARVFDSDYLPSAVRVTDLEIERRIPEFAWDAAGDVAWGARLYGDSFVIAARPDIVERLHRDPRIDTVPVRKDRDVMPPSAGD